MCFLASVGPDRVVVRPRAVARGNREAVLAAARDAEPGEILIHNHPSGHLEPSDADLALAARIYQEGIGSGIVDNEARSLYVVVEPPAPVVRPELDPDEIAAFVSPGGALARVHPGFEDRAAQRTMLAEVVRAYNEGGVALVEAGTGTGKSLAYLLPAARWALLGGGRTVVSTNTINLQEQLVGKDLPLVRELLGEDLRWTLAKGRGNYVSIRRLLLAADTAPSLFEDDRTGELQALVRWIAVTEDGSLSDLPQPPTEEVWDEVRSDGDVCLGARCPHFQKCFYQRARREANGAHVVVANHALLLTDVAVRRSTGNWTEAAVLPHYRHVVLDEGHNVEDAATRHLGVEVTRVGLFRALDRLDRGGKGLLGAVEEAVEGGASGGGPGGPAGEISRRVTERVRPLVQAAREALVRLFDAVEPCVPGAEEEPLRLGRGDPRDPSRDRGVQELLDTVRAELARLEAEVERLRLEIAADDALADRLEGRLLDLQSVERRLAGGRDGLGTVLGPATDGILVRWIEGRWSGGRLRNVLLAAAPAEPGEILKEGLFDRLEGAVVTSATLSTGRTRTGGGDFRFLRDRLGLRGEGDGPAGAGPRGSRGADPEEAVVFRDSGAPVEVREALLPSPFDYRTQAILGVPTDLPEVTAGEPFQQATARAIAEFAEVTGGGIFVLFTSHRALRSVARHLRAAGVERRWPLMVHGEGARSRLLDEFTRAEDAILLGTSSFWEGVDVPGRPLRGLVLQKLPFRVPTEPVTQARMEALEARGENPFDAYLVPLAALRLKQGFGRLVRTRTDRGAVLLLDGRVLTRRYGPTLLAALPEAPLVTGPWADLRKELERFYRMAGPGAS